MEENFNLVLQVVDFFFQNKNKEYICNPVLLHIIMGR